MKSLICYFFLLILEISLHFNLDASHKWGRFFKTLLEKDFKFILNRNNSIIAFNLSFVLLLAEVNLVLEK